MSHPAPDLEPAAAAEAAVLSAVSSLPPEAWAGPSLLPGWTRAHVVAHLAANADAFVRAADGAVRRGATGEGDTRMYTSREARDAEIEELAGTDPESLAGRLSASSAALRRVWEGLTPEQWELPFTNGAGRAVPVRAALKGRTREVWVHLVDLDAPGSTGFAQLPADVSESVLREVAQVWSARGDDAGLAVSTTASDGASLTLGAAEAPGTVLVEGPLAAVTAWATGRAAGGPGGLTATRDGSPVDVPEAPAWI